MADGISLYEQDFVRWSQDQAEALRSAAASGTNLPLDWDNLAEEVESLGKALRNELRSRILTVIEHLLKLQHSPSFDPRHGWMETIARERGDIEQLIEDNPSLRSSLPEAVLRGQTRALKLVKLSLASRGETALDLPGELDRAPLTVDQVVGDWLPERVR